MQSEDLKKIIFRHVESLDHSGQHRSAELFQPWLVRAVQVDPRVRHG
jgi:hypothetical protein